jgi:hypothetical protein
MSNSDRRGWLHPSLVVAPSGGLVRNQRCPRLYTRRGDFWFLFSPPRSEQRRRAGGRDPIGKTSGAPQLAGLRPSAKCGIVSPLPHAEGRLIRVRQ